MRSADRFTFGRFRWPMLSSAADFAGGRLQPPMNSVTAVRQRAVVRRMRGPPSRTSRLFQCARPGQVRGGGVLRLGWNRSPGDVVNLSRVPEQPALSARAVAGADL